MLFSPFVAGFLAKHGHGFFGEEKQHKSVSSTQCDDQRLGLKRKNTWPNEEDEAILKVKFRPSLGHDLFSMLWRTCNVKENFQYVKKYTQIILK